MLAATPLGDVRDASPRLVEALATADVIAAEDTRQAALAGRRARRDARPAGCVSFYDQVETARLPGLRRGAARRARPCCSSPTPACRACRDPGYRLVAACVAEDLPVTCLPGPSAVTTALAAVRAAVRPVLLRGLPAAQAGRAQALVRRAASRSRAPCVFFESPHRLADTLADAVEVLGPDRRAAVCRELTKTYEEVRRGTLAELAEWAAEGVRGEITVVLAPAPRQRSVPTWTRWSPRSSGVSPTGNG